MLASIFAFVLGLGFFAAGYSYVSLARRMRTFRSTPAKITAREVVRDPTASTVTGRYGDGGGYLPSVSYRYTVDGTELVGDKITFAKSPVKHAVALRKLGEIPDDVTAWYNPDKPAEVYLQKHTPTVGWLILVFSVLWELGALVAIVSHLTD
jgi:Protein of unknown function (DUF3592)